MAANFTAEPILPVLEFWWERTRLGGGVSVAGYDQVFQQLLDPGSELASNNGVNVLLLRLGDFRRNHVEGELEDEDFLRRIGQELRDALRGFVERVSTPLVVAFCPEALEGQRAERVAKVRASLEDELRGLPSVSLLTDEDVSVYAPATCFDSERDRLGHIPYTEEFFAALGSAVARRGHALLRNPAKVLVLDCDNTIWGGVVGEDGPDGVSIDSGHRALQAFAVESQRKGVVLALSSKNVDEDVVETFRRRSEMPLSLDHIVTRRVNWDSKAQNIADMAQELNVGIDSFVFLDDNPVECGQVRELLPEVCTLQVPDEPDLPRFVRHLWCLDLLKVTDEDRKRTELYRQAAERNRFESSVTDMSSFIRGLELHVEIETPVESQLPRVAQLTQRTNQFNLTTIRRSEAEIRSLAESGKHALQCSVRDRFGDYGLVGVMIYGFSDEALELDSMMLSCRTLGRGVEHAMLAKLGEIARASDKRRVDVPFVPSKKNKPAQNFVESLGAEHRTETGSGYLYRLPVDVAAKAEFSQQYAEKQLAIARAREVKTSKSKSDVSPSSMYQSIADELTSAARVRQAIDARLERERPSTMAAPVAARSGTEQELVALWKAILSVGEIGVRDDFFELGGESLQAASLFAELERRFDRRLPLTTILDARTIEALAELLDAGGDSTTEDSESDVVTLRAGRAGVTPCFFLHDGLGETLLYLNVAHRLPEGVPVYGVEPRRSRHARIVHTSIEAMARDYVQRIRKTWPSGPYVLIGLCAGGVLAFEVGRRLESAGAEVAFVGIIDGAAPGAPQRGNTAERRGHRLTELFSRFRTDRPLATSRRIGTELVRKASNLVRYEVGSRYEQLQEQARISLTDYLQDREGRALAPLSVQQVYDAAERRFQPVPWECPAVLFRATEAKNEGPDDVPYSLLYEDDRTLGWDELCRGRLEVVDCPGGHTSLLQEPHAERISERLGRVWDGDAVPAVRAAEHLRRRVRTIIVNYKTARLTLQGVRSLLPARRVMPNLDVVVVENDSGDGEVLKRGLSDPAFERWTRLDVAPRNGGFAYGNNRAVRPALQEDDPPDYFFLLNPDASVHPGALETLVEFMEHNPSVGIAGAGLQNADGSDWKVAFKFPTATSEFVGGLSVDVVSTLFRSRLVAQNMTNERVPIDWVPGAAMIVRREVFEDAGLMDESYFLYYEETDFCLAARRAGWECWYVPDARVTHIAGQSTGVTVRGAEMKRLPAYWYESRTRYFRKNHGASYAAKADGAYILGLALNKVESFLLRRDEGRPALVIQDTLSHSVFSSGAKRRE